MTERTQAKPQPIRIKPLYPIATFISVRKKINLLQRFPICLVDLLPPGIKLTANETKVLFVLRAARMGRTNLAAIDQDKIAELSLVKQQNVARAIAGLRTKGLIRQTWMEAGAKMFRNIYAIWTPPELLEKDADVMLRKRNKAVVLEQQANEMEMQSQPKEAKKLRQKAERIRAGACSTCGGEGVTLIYLPSQHRERLRWCDCSVGYKKAEQLNCLDSIFVPDNLTATILNNA